MVHECSHGEGGSRVIREGSGRFENGKRECVFGSKDLEQSLFDLCYGRRVGERVREVWFPCFPYGKSLLPRHRLHEQLDGRYPPCTLNQ